MANFLKKLLALWTASLMSSVLFVPNLANATGIFVGSGAGPWDGGYSEMLMMGGAFSPFMGGGYFPGAEAYYMTGEMDFGGRGYRNPLPLYLATHLNWNGSQAMGHSYLPPMGLSALGNTLGYRAISGN